MEKQPIFEIDNISVFYPYQKRRSKDRLAHSIIKASFCIAGALACYIHVSWSPRRSSPEACIADDLTHNDFSSALMFDPDVLTMLYEDFPPPLSMWMQGAREDSNLGHNILEWMKLNYHDLL